MCVWRSDALCAQFLTDSDVVILMTPNRITHLVICRPTHHLGHLPRCLKCCDTFIMHTALQGASCQKVCAGCSELHVRTKAVREHKLRTSAQEKALPGHAPLWGALHSGMPCTLFLLSKVCRFSVCCEVFTRLQRMCMAAGRHGSDQGCSGTGRAYLCLHEGSHTSGFSSNMSFT